MPNSKSNQRCCVYVIEQETTGYIKIGIADNPESRILDLQIGSPFPLSLKGAIKCANRDIATIVERYMHLCYQPVQAVGEWFRVPANQALSDINTVADVAHRFRANYSVQLPVPEGIESQSGPYSSYLGLAVWCFLFSIINFLQCVVIPTSDLMMIASALFVPISTFCLLLIIAKEHADVVRLHDELEDTSRQLAELVIDPMQVELFHAD